LAKYLLDSDVVIAWLRRDGHVTAWLREHDAAGDYLACTPITVAEVYAGLRPHEEFVIGDIMRVLHCVAIDERVGRKAGRYRQRFGRSYGVGLPAALIAAAAHVHGLILCTRNLRHFPMRDLRKRRV
jgi:predicted nucleic acid-binding protein